MACAGLLIRGATAGTPAFSVSIDDPGGLYAPYHAGIQSNLLSACQWWGLWIVSSAPIDVRVGFDDAVDGCRGRSVVWSYLFTTAGFNVYEPGAATKLRTLADPNGGDPDIEITINPAYLASGLWFDPDPALRTAPVDTDRDDAVSVFLHELGHALAFDGWIEGFYGTFPGVQKSLFDHHLWFDLEDFSYWSPDTERVYAGPLPMTFGSPFHVGNEAPRPGSGLSMRLMNGAGIRPGVRYRIGLLELAVLRAQGLVTRIVPCRGDANMNGLIDFGDLTRVLAVFGGDDAQADVDQSGEVGFADITTVLANWGACAAGTPAALPGPSGPTLTHD